MIALAQGQTTAGDNLERGPSTTKPAVASLGESLDRSGEPIETAANEANPTPPVRETPAPGARYSLPQWHEETFARTAREVREKLGWGSLYTPPLLHAAEYAEYRRICDDLASELAEIEDYVVDGTVTDEGSGAIVEIEHLLEQLYDLDWSDDEMLQRAVVAIQSQVNNIQWTTEHIGFLKDAVAFLRPRYVFTEDTIDQCYRIIERHGLDPFRGTVSESEVLRRFRIVEVQEG